MLQVEEVGEAHPQIVKAVETMIKKGKWTVPGSLPHFLVVLGALCDVVFVALQVTRRNLETFLLCNRWRSQCSRRKSTFLDTSCCTTLHEQVMIPNSLKLQDHKGC